MKIKFKNTVRALSLFANVGIAETYLSEVGVEVVVANELLEERVGLLHSDTVSCYFEKVDLKQQDISLREYYDRTKKQVYCYVYFG